jgi:hypothetical protein
VKSTPCMHQRWLMLFAELKATMSATPAGHAVKRAITGELRALAFSEVALREELAAHRARVKAEKNKRNRPKAAEWQRRRKEKNIERARAMQREHARARRASGLVDRSKERAREAVKRASLRNAAIQSLEDLLRDRAARASVIAQKAASKAVAIEEREAARLRLGPTPLDRRRSRDRVRKMEWKYRAYRKLGRNAHRMPELVELYKTTCELKRARR